VRYGTFDDEKREYVITDPRTPVKWINYVGTLAFGGFVDHTGGSVICKGDPALNRITRYVVQLPVSMFNGETLYLRFPEGDGYRVFSPYFVPTLDPYDLYRCHVGLGYVRIVSECFGIRTEATIFVPRDSERLIRDIAIVNVSPRTLEIDAVPVVEYSHPNALLQFTNADWVPQTMRSEAHREPDGRLILTQFAFMNKDSRINIFTSNQPVSSFESARRRFLGENGYGTWANPLSLRVDELSNYEARRGDTIGALLHHLGPLQPGASARLITQLCQDTSVETARPLIERYRDAAQVDEAFRELIAFWDDYLAKFRAATPDSGLNRMINMHNPRQCHTTKNWSRYLSRYQLGFGARGVGFRDSSQDVMGILTQAPHEGRELIEQLLHLQKRGGSAMHQFNPFTMVGNEGDSREMEDRPKYYGDDHLWIVLAITAYLKETGDLSFLDQVIPYYDKDRDGHPLASGTVLDHMRAAITFTWKDVGQHGLPLLGFADWNDTVNLPAGAESLFVANLFGKALLELIELARHLSDEDTVALYSEYYGTMKRRVNQHAWDGAWYVRYFDAGGRPIGSQENRRGQIYANAQSWPIISGFATPERGRKALEALYDRLNTSKGIKLSTPGYDGYDSQKGGITTYPPGAKENGGIFLHTNAWVIMAETMLGNGDRALEYYRQINPAAKNDIIDEYECEPYVYAQNILGDEHPGFGLARNSWLTGTASWANQAATQYILGITPTYAGLRIDPCIARTWNGFEVTRAFRDAVYQIKVRNPDHVSKGVTEVQLDGETIPGNVVPALGDGRTHQVDITMGQEG